MRSRCQSVDLKANYRNGDSSKWQLCGLRPFFKWVSVSVKTTSAKIVQERGEAFQLPSLPPGVELAKSDEGNSHPPSWLFLQVKCSSSGSFYLIRYKQDTMSEGGKGVRPTYSCAAVHPLEDFEFESASASTAQAIDVNSLRGSLPCPYCRLQSWGQCPCGRILCTKPEGGKHECPWCRKTSFYSVSEFKVNTGRG